MTNSPRHVRSNEGFVLVLALGILAVLSLMAAALVDSMMLEDQSAEFDLGVERARQSANAGVQVAIGQITAASASGTANALAGSSTALEFPGYAASGPPHTAPAPSPKNFAKVSVSIHDESGKVNVNYAPPNVLRIVLGVDGDTARRIRSSLPRLVAEEDDPSVGERRWFASVDELVTRGLLPADALTPEKRALLTVHSVADAAHATGYINLNSAPVPVLQAVLDVSPEAAESIASARPFASAAEVTAAAGKDPSQFSYRSTPDALPAELSLTPRCFRIVSSASVAENSGIDRFTTTKDFSIEAIVVIDDNGIPHITNWNEYPGKGEADTAAPAA